MSTVKLVPKKEQTQADNAEYVRALADRMGRGEIQGALVFIVTDKGYALERVGVTIEQGIVLCARMSYALNKDWDDYHDNKAP